jgi:tRNA 2-thiouridine synthesizing protein E
MNQADITNLAFDEYGFMTDPSRWNELVANALAAQLGIPQLTEDHWKVLGYVREHYLQHHTLPWTKHVCHEQGLEDGCVRRLFKGPIEVWKIAGLPDPGTEARIYMEDEE